MRGLGCGGDEKVKNKAKQQLCACITLFCTFLCRQLQLHELPVKMPNFKFCKGRKQAMTKFILFMTLDVVDRNSAPEEFACTVTQDVTDAGVNTFCKLKLVFLEKRL